MAVAEPYEQAKNGIVSLVGLFKKGVLLPFSLGSARKDIAYKCRAEFCNSHIYFAELLFGA